MQHDYSGLIGVKFNFLTLLRLSGQDDRGNTMATFLCACGAETEKRLSSVRLGDTKSCGCHLRTQAALRETTHGLSRTVEYKTWNHMMSRCYNTSDISYNNYGGRGITVCERWHKVENFVEDMGKKPFGRSLDRIDNDGNYEPTNCKWSTRTEQALNRRPRSLSISA